MFQGVRMIGTGKAFFWCFFTHYLAETLLSLPLSLNGVSSKECIQKTKKLAEMFGLKEHLNKYPYLYENGHKKIIEFYSKEKINEILNKTISM